MAALCLKGAPFCGTDQACRTCGEMAEWSKAPHSKCGVPVTVPRVRIPISPPFNQAIKLPCAGGAICPNDSMADETRIPVIIGVGQVNDRECVQDSLGLMVEALAKADADAGGGWINQLDSIAVVAQISFGELGDCSQLLAKHFGISPKHVEQTPYATGESPTQLLNEAANRIGAGEIGVAAIIGGEALRTSGQRKAAARTDGAKPDFLRDAASPKQFEDITALAGSIEHLAQYGLVAPTDVYPLYENATRAAWGQSLSEAQAESGQIWAGMSRVAAGNPNAWIQTAIEAEAIITPDADNRPITYPYQKRMVANSSVNQGAAFIVTSLAKARAARIGEDHIIYVGMGAAAHTPHNLLKRDQYAHSAAIDVTLEQTLKRNGLTTADLTDVELYSCFPCIPKMARRVIGWPVDKPITAFGGLTFGGGPIGNYMSHAVASMVDKLRRDKGTALLFANGGYATHNHAIVISSEPMAQATFPHDFNCNEEAKARRGHVADVDGDYQGSATIETYTVFYKRDGSVRFGSIIARTPEGKRVLAKVPAEDEAMIAFLTDGKVEAVGSAGQVRKGDGGLMLWSAV
jgi:acetyl-CoA C-acetyltransferase